MLKMAAFTAVIFLAGCESVPVQPPPENSDQHYIRTHTCQWERDLPSTTPAYWDGTKVTHGIDSFSVYICTDTGEDVHVYPSYVDGKPWHP